MVKKLVRDDDVGLEGLEFGTKCVAYYIVNGVAFRLTARDIHDRRIGVHAVELELQRFFLSPPGERAQPITVAAAHVNHAQGASLGHVVQSSFKRTYE